MMKVTDKLKEMISKNIPHSIISDDTEYYGKSILSEKYNSNNPYNPNYDLTVEKFIKENVKSINNINMIIVNEHTYRSIFNLRNENTLTILDPFINNAPIDMSPPQPLSIAGNDVTITISNAVNDGDIFIKSEKGKTLL